MSTLSIAQDPVSVDLSVLQGDTRTFEVDFDINLTGYTFVAQAGTTSITVTNVDLALGQISFRLTSTHSQTKGTFPWFLKWTDPDGDVRTIFSGSLIVK